MRWRTADPGCRPHGGLNPGLPGCQRFALKNGRRLPGTNPKGSKHGSCGLSEATPTEHEQRDLHPEGMPPSSRRTAYRKAVAATPFGVDALENRGPRVSPARRAQPGATGLSTLRVEEWASSICQTRSFRFSILALRWFFNRHMVAFSASIDVSEINAIDESVLVIAAGLFVSQSPLAPLRDENPDAYDCCHADTRQPES